jgi:hypothetical protein
VRECERGKKDVRFGHLEIHREPVQPVRLAQQKQQPTQARAEEREQVRCPARAEVLQENGNEPEYREKQEQVGDNPRGEPHRLKRPPKRARQMSQREIKPADKCGRVFFRRKRNRVEPTPIVTLEHFRKVTLRILGVHNDASEFQARARECITQRVWYLEHRSHHHRDPQYNEPLVLGD